MLYCCSQRRTVANFIGVECALSRLGDRIVSNITRYFNIDRLFFSDCDCYSLVYLHGSLLWLSNTNDMGSNSRKNVSYIQIIFSRQRMMENFSILYGISIWATRYNQDGEIFGICSCNCINNTKSTNTISNE